MTETLSELLNAPTLTFAPIATAALLLAFPPFAQYSETGTLAELLARVYRLALVIAVTVEPVLAHPVFWLLVTCVHFLWIASAYAIADNHHYLEGYWCCALVVALYVGGDAGNAILTRNAMLLVALPFLFSVIWKLASATFRNGSFFVYQLLVDPRFGALSHLLARATAERMMAFARARRSVIFGASDRESIEIPAAFRRVALFMTWWTVAIESAIAVAFLAPVEHLHWWQLGPMIVFAITTYVFVPITTFSNILLLMLAVSTNDPGLRALILSILCIMTIAMFLGSKSAAGYQKNYSAFLNAATRPRPASANP